MKKVLISALAIVLVACCAIGGTLAWLQTQTDTVTNTFTYGDITIKLDESVLGDDGALTSSRTESGNSNYKMLPATDLPKDPKVTVKAESEACWLFVKIDESANFRSFMSYNVNSVWTVLDATNYPGVYYYNGTALNSYITADKEFEVLANNKVSVSSSVTKDMFTASGYTAPTLKFTAYAVQKDGFDTPAAAWAVVG